VGPFRGPARPKSLPQVSALPLTDLLAHLGAAAGPHDYAVKIRYHEIKQTSRRRRPMSDADYAKAVSDYNAELARKAALEGFRTITYDIPPGAWTADDLTQIVGLVYSVLPAPMKTFYESPWKMKTGSASEGESPPRATS
jgi:hypothetical protein